MKKKKLAALTAAGILCISVLFTGCDEKGGDVKGSSFTSGGTVTSDSKDDNEESPLPESGSGEQTDPEQSSAPAESAPAPENQAATEINIYGINDTTLESEPVKATVNGEITAESIVMAVVKDFEEHSLKIGIDSITAEGTTVIVSFKKDMAPLVQVGTDVEVTILNCISDSLLDNLEDCSAVIFQAEGEAYESGHLYYEKDEVYASE